MSAGNRWKPHIQASKAGATPKVIDVGERIEFPAEIALRVGHAGDAAVEPVEEHGKTDCHGGEVEVPRFGERAADRFKNRVESSRDISGGEQRRQDVHAFAHASRGRSVSRRRGVRSVHEASLLSGALQRLGCRTGSRASIDGSTLDVVAEFDLDRSVGDRKGRPRGNRT